MLPKALILPVAISLLPACASVPNAAPYTPRPSHSSIELDAQFEEQKLTVVAREQFFCLDHSGPVQRYRTERCGHAPAEGVPIEIRLSEGQPPQHMVLETNESGVASRSIRGEELGDVPYEYPFVRIRCSPQYSELRCGEFSLDLPSEITAPWVLTRADEVELAAWLQHHGAAEEAPALQRSLAELTEANDALAIEHLERSRALFNDETIALPDRLRGSKETVQQCLSVRPFHDECQAQLERIHIELASWLLGRAREAIESNEPLQAAARLDECLRMSADHCGDEELERRLIVALERYQPAQIQELTVLPTEEGYRIYFILVNHAGEQIRPWGLIRYHVDLFGHEHSNYHIQENELTTEDYLVAGEAHHLFDPQTVFVDGFISSADVFSVLPIPQDAIRKRVRDANPRLVVTFEPFARLEFLKLPPLQALVPIDL